MQQELSSDSIARLVELKGGCNVKSIALIFRLWMWARKCSMQLWASIYHAKSEPYPSYGLALIALETLQHITLMLISKLWDLDLKVISLGVKIIWT